MNAAKNALAATLFVAIHGLIAALLASLVMGMGTTVLATVLGALGLHLSDFTILSTVGAGAAMVALWVMVGLLTGKGDVL